MKMVSPKIRRVVRQLSAAALILTLLAAASPSHATESELTVPAQESTAPPDEEAGLAPFVHQILANLFNSRGLMETLRKPQFAIPAFVALNLIIFVETGLLVGFFLPGDSLLVTAGLICASPHCGWSLPLLLATLCLAAIIGDSVGYMIGYQTGPKIFNREQSLLFNKEHLLKAQRFYEAHGGKTIVLARFMPILRTFAPVVAGVGRMRYHQFVFFNVFGGISWVLSMVLAGYFLPSAVNPLLRPLFGASFHVEDHIEKVIILVVLLSISPALWVWLRSKLKGKPAVEPVLAGDGKQTESASVGA
jgi:membrane-associated protein